MTRRRKLYLITLGVLVLVMLVTAVVASGQGRRRAQKQDFGGRSIRWATWWDSAPQPGRSEREDLRLQREAEVGKKYNVKFEYLNVPWGEFMAKYITTVMAGDAMAEIVSVQTDWFYPTLLLNNFCLNLSELGVFDFKASKFQKETIEFATLDGSVYGYEIGRIEPRGVIFFNKTMFEREGISDIYDTVFNYKWTWSEMLKVAKKLTRDTDGDGVIDQWGLAGATGRIWRGFIISNGANFIDISDKWKPRFSLGDPAALEALQAYQDFIIKEKVVLVSPEGSPWDYPVQAFIDGKVGMLVAQLWNIDKLRDNMSDEYGVILFPMGPRMKEYTSEATLHHFKVFPVTVKNPEQVAIVENEMTEPYNVRGELLMMEEKNEEWLEMRVTDDESIKIVQMIWDKQMSIFNLQEAFGVMDIFYTIDWELQTGNSTPQAAVEEYAQEAQMRINDSLLL